MIAIEPRDRSADATGHREARNCQPNSTSSRSRAPFHPLADDDDQSGTQDQDGADEGVGAGDVSPDQIAEQEGPDQRRIFERRQHRDGRLPHAFEQRQLAGAGDDAG